ASDRSLHLSPLFSDRFFFSSRRRHTSSKRDWSSDVCSSDLAWSTPTTAKDPSKPRTAPRCGWAGGCRSGSTISPGCSPTHACPEIGRASCRERVWVMGDGETIIQVAVPHDEVVDWADDTVCF